MPRAPLLCLLVLGCGGPAEPDAGARDAGTRDAGRADAGPPDAGRDAGPRDAGPPIDAGPEGTFALTFTVRLDPALGDFEPLTLREAECTIDFPVPEVRGSGPMRVFESPAARVSCSPDPPSVVTRLALNLDGQPATLTVFGGPAAEDFPTTFTMSGREGGMEYFAIRNDCTASAFPNDGAQVVLGPFRCEAGMLLLERFDGTIAPGSLTDSARADSILEYSR